MPVISLIILLALLGLVVWAVVTFIPMPAQFRTLIIVVGAVIALLYVLGALGILPAVTSIQVPRVR